MGHLARVLLVVAAVAGPILVACSSFEAADGEPSAEAGPGDAEAGGDEAASSVDAGDAADTAPADRHLYVFGGGTVNDAGAKSFVTKSYRAQLLAGGALGPWTRVPELDVSQAEAVVLQPAVGLVTAIAGERTSLDIYTGSVSAAAIPPPSGAGGSAWHESSPVPDTVNGMAGVGEAGWILVGGGSVATGARHASLFVTNVVGAGVGTWTSAGALPAPLSGHAMALVTPRLYVVGGTAVAGNIVGTTWAANYTSGGGLGPWIDAGALPITVSGHRLLAIGARLYVLGSVSTNNTGSSEVWAGTAAPEGAVTWAGASPLGVPATAVCAIADGDTIYVVGGRDDIFTPLAAVQTTKVVGAGTLDPWKTLAPLPEGRFGAGCAIR